MGKVLILHDNRDAEIAMAMKEGLEKQNHSVKIISEIYSAGDSLHKIILNGLEDVDIVVPIFTQTIISTYYKNQIHTVLGYLSKMNNKSFTPITFGEFTIPSDLGNISWTRFERNELDGAVKYINAAIIGMLSRNKAEEVKRKEEIKRIKENSDVYIEDTLKTLRKREDKYRNNATFCYVLGYVTLIIGVVFGIFNFNNNISAEFQWYQYLYISLRALIVLVFLAACSKYAFSLGKAYMNESLKNADRMHAISFGEFYLKAYSEKATWEELKEVFQYWNLDKNSYFTNLNSDDFDPKIIEIIEKIGKSISIKN